MAFTFALPFLFSLFFALPFGLIGSFSFPASSAESSSPPTFFVFASSNHPAGHLEVSFALPFCLFFFTLPTLNSFEGGGSLGGRRWRRRLVPGFALSP